MALKTTQRQLKRRFRSEVKNLKWAILAKCFDCSGFQADGYMDCKMDDCPLYPYRLKQPIGRTSKSLASYLRMSEDRIQRKTVSLEGTNKGRG